MKIGETRVVDPMEVLKASRRFDLVFKLALAKAYAGGDAREIREAEEAYLEAVRSRNGFFEAEPFRDCPADFVRSFKATAASIRENGYDMSKPPIPVDADMELLNGAHRLACCAAYGLKCPVKASDMYPAGGSVMRTFVLGHIHPAVLNWGVRKYLELVPGGCLAADYGDASRWPEMPFPDWAERNRKAWKYKVKPALSWAWYSLTLPFKRGAAREKQLRRILRERKKITGFAALADYWKGGREHA